MDSIYRNYPIGSLLVWESTQKLASKRNIADLAVAARSEQYPVNYLLDGQQRLSAICGVIYWTPGGEPRSVWNVIFDLKTGRFSHTDQADGFPTHQIPLRRMSDAPEFYRRLGPLDDPFNSTGTRLTIYDLMRAATWSPEFDLGNTVDDIKRTLEPKKYNTLDNKTFLRTLGAAAGGDFSAQSIDALRELPKDKLSSAPEAMKGAALRAADFLTTQISAPGGGTALREPVRSSL